MTVKGKGGGLKTLAGFAGKKRGQEEEGNTLPEIVSNVRFLPPLSHTREGGGDTTTCESSSSRIYRSDYPRPTGMFFWESANFPGEVLEKRHSIALSKKDSCTPKLPK